MKKRMLSLLLVFVMVLGMLPTAISAAEGEETVYPVTITAPAGSTVSVGTMHTYYIYTFAEPKSIQNDGDQVVYGFDVPTSHGNAFVRVQHPEGVTYWDYTNLTEGTAIEITEDDLFMNDDKHDSDTIIRDFSEYVHDVADVYINANAQGYLPMKVGGSFEFNVFRDWHAVEGIQNAKTALPDVSYQVIDINGNPSDVVTVVPDENNSSVANMTANKAGTAIVLVTYDAMYSTLALRGAIGTDTAAPAFFSAIWPENTGVLVVTVGADGTSVQTNMTMNNHPLDAEHDVIYYLGDAGASYTFTPEAGCEVSVARAELTEDSLTYHGFTTEGVTVAESGAVTVSGLTAGSHIVKVEKNGLATYQVICAKQTTATITREDGTEVTANDPADPGEKLTVQLGDVYNPVNKLSGIYNSNCAITYIGEDKATFYGDRKTGFGYYLFASDPDAHKVTVTLPAVWAQDTYALNGYFGVGGFGSPAGTHRDLKYSVGQAVQDEAKVPSSLMGRLPEVIIPVNASERVAAQSVELNNNSLSLNLKGSAVLSATVLPENSTDRVIWSSSDSSVASVDDGGVVTGIAAGTATITAKVGDVTARCVVTVQETVAENLVLTTEAAFLGEVFVATMDLSEIIIGGVELAGSITDVYVEAGKNVIVPTDDAEGRCTIPLQAGEYESLTLTLKPLLGMAGQNSRGKLFYYCNDTLSNALSTYEDNAYTVSVPLTWEKDKAELVMGLCMNGMNNVRSSYTITLTREQPEGFYAVVLPEVQTGYTIVPAAGSESPVVEGDSYSFTVEIADGYEATDAFAVKANGVAVEPLAGYYNITGITEKQIITVEGVSVVETSKVYQNGENGAWGNPSFGWVESVAIGGATVDGYLWTENTCSITLNSKTPKDAKVYVVYERGGGLPGWAENVSATLDGKELLPGVPATVTLTNGQAQAQMFAIYNNNDRYSGTKTFVFTVAEPTCVYDQQNTDEKYLKSAADCDHAAVYYYSCECSEIGEETFTYGEALGHEFDDGFCIRCDEKQPDYVDPDPETVTVTLSLSRDAGFMVGKETGAVMAFRDIEVPYFDLANYGLEQFYFSSETYGGDGSGAPSSDLEPGTAKYAKDKVTLLHLYIYALERFYCGAEEEHIGQGYLLNEGLLGTETLNIGGSQGSIFLIQFWGYDCNMNYYVNYEYPLASDGWGATADQILLRDGDMVTLGSFTSWNFFNDSATVFNYLSVDGDLNTHEVSVAQGDKVTLTVYRAGPDTSGSFGTAQTVVTSCPDVYYIAREDAVADVTEWTWIGAADDSGKIELDTTSLAPGQYLVCLPGQYGEYYPDEICSSPGGIILTVEPCEHRTQEPIPGKDATCTETGQTEGKKCSVCGEVTVAQEEIPAPGHRMTKTEAKAPTTEEAGNVEYWKCADCGKLFMDQKGKNVTTLEKVTLEKLPESARVYTVTFDPNGGASAPAAAKVGNGKTVARPADAIPSDAEHKEFDGWYTDKACTKAWDFEHDVVTGNVTLYAKWVDVFTVSGIVKHADGSPAADVKVSLMQGSYVFATDVTNENGEYSIEHIYSGAYNLVAEKTDDHRTTTAKVNVDSDKTVDPVVLPAENVSSKLEVSEDTPKIVVGGLDQEAVENSNEDDEVHVDVSMTMEQKQDLSDKADTDLNDEEKEQKEAQKDIKVKAEENKPAAEERKYVFIEMEIKKTEEKAGQEDTVTAITETIELLEILVPFQTDGRNDFKVFRKHDDRVDELTTTKNANGEYIVVGEGMITIYARNFSTYAITYVVEEKTPETPNVPHIPVEPAIKPVVKPVTTVKFPFTDVTVTDWYYDEVKEAWENDLIDGMTADTFDPDGKLTIAQAIKLAAALHQMEKNGKVTLKNGDDVWYSTYVDYAINNGIIDEAYGDLTHAQMNAAATRKEFVHILHGARDFYAKKNTVADNAIPDVKLGDEYADEIYAFYRAGILTGNDDAGTFAPNSGIKRSEVAAILIRMYDVSARQTIKLQ